MGFLWAGGCVGEWDSAFWKSTAEFRNTSEGEKNNVHSCDFSIAGSVVPVSQLEL